MPVALLVSLAAVALVLDAVDGWVARRTRTTATLGARFDGEVDAFLILVLSVYVARSAGAWVLAIGAARYAFLVAGWLLPWMRAPLPPRYWRKVVAATQGIVLTVAAADVLPPALTRAALVGALALLAESFGRDVWWLWAAGTRSDAADRSQPTRPADADACDGIAVALTILALLLVWAALVAPHQPSQLTPGAFVRLPLEGLVLVALAVVLPADAAPRRWPWSRAGARAAGHREGPRHGVLHGLRPAVQPRRRLELRRDRHRDAARRRSAVAREPGDRRRRSRSSSRSSSSRPWRCCALTRVAAGHRRWSLRAVAALGVVWVLCCGVVGAPVASTSAAGLAADEVQRGAGRPAGPRGLRRARSPTTASAPRPATGC